MKSKLFLMTIVMLMIVAFVTPAAFARDVKVVRHGSEVTVVPVKDKAPTVVAQAKKEAKPEAEATVPAKKVAKKAEPTFSNREQSVGRLICGPLKACGKVFVDVVDTITFQRPAAVFNILRDVRREGFDIGEGILLLATGDEPIPIEDMGELNTAITDAGVDWLVDGILYGVGTGVALHNSHYESQVFHHLRDWKIGAWTAAGVAASDLIGSTADED